MLCCVVLCCVALGACCRVSREQSDGDGCCACRVSYEQNDGNDVLVLLVLVDEFVSKVVILCWLGRLLWGEY